MNNDRRTDSSGTPDEPRLLAKTLGALTMCCLLTACQTLETTRSGAVQVDREQRVLSFISEQDLQASAAEVYNQQLQQAKAEGKLNTDAALLRRVTAISRRLIQQTAAFRDDARGWPWEINVLSSPERNAYAMPGGKIMVYSGLISGMKLNDAEIAAVVGHEIAHTLREHARERVSNAFGQQLLLTLGAAAGAEDRALQLADAVGQVTFQLPHSREQESEADQIGMELMARAGYDPQAAIAVWEKMTAAGTSSGQPPEFLSTHPSNESRVAELRANLPRVLPLYQARN